MGKSTAHGPLDAAPMQQPFKKHPMRVRQIPNPTLGAMASAYGRNGTFFSLK